MSWIPRKCRRKQTDEEAKNEAKPLMTVREAMASFLAGMEHIFGALVVLTLVSTFASCQCISFAVVLSPWAMVPPF